MSNGFVQGGKEFNDDLILISNYQVEVVALSSYEEKEEQFKEQVYGFCDTL